MVSGIIRYFLSSFGVKVISLRLLSRKREKRFDADKAVNVKEDKNGTAIVRAQRIVTQSGEIELYCHSLPREAKERSM